MLNKSEKFYAIFFSAVAVLIWAFFTIIDFQFSESVFQYSTALEWMARISMAPSLIIGWIFGLRLTAYGIRGNLLKDKNSTPLSHMIIGIVVTILFPVYLFWSILRLSDMATDSNSWVMMIVLIVLSIVAGLRLTSKHKEGDALRLSSRALTGLLILLINLAISVLIALIWQRDTYISILYGEAETGYTPWYQPNLDRLVADFISSDISFGSFPSFIATNAFSLSILVYLQDKHNHNFRDFLFVLSILYGIAVSVVLVMSGKAYVTDCFASLFVSMVSLTIGTFFYQKQAKKLNF